MSGITPVVYSRLNARENQLRFVQSSNFFVGNDETETYLKEQWYFLSFYQTTIYCSKTLMS